MADLAHVAPQPGGDPEAPGRVNYLPCELCSTWFISLLQHFPQSNILVRPPVVSGLWS